MPRYYFLRAAITAACVMFSAASAVADSAHVRDTGPILSQPRAGAPAAGTVKAGAAVDIVERKGFWAHIRNGSQTGWLKLSRLSLDSGGSGNQIAALASGRTGSNNVVSASGGRGLDATDLATATPNGAAVTALARTAVSEAAAVKFASVGKLKTRSLGYLSSGVSR